MLKFSGYSCLIGGPQGVVVCVGGAWRAEDVKVFWNGAQCRVTVPCRLLCVPLAHLIRVELLGIAAQSRW